jgi:hypothetical protein
MSIKLQMLCVLFLKKTILFVGKSINDWHERAGLAFEDGIFSFL